MVASVAPGAKLLALDVFRANGLAYDSDLLAAIEFTIRHRDTWNVRAINLSIADSTHWVAACPLSGLGPAFDSARAAGMVLTVASGNGAAHAGQYIDGIAYPACVPGALTSAACTTRTSDPLPTPSARMRRPRPTGSRASAREVLRLACWRRRRPSAPADWSGVARRWRRRT